ncbi:MAG: DNA modification methylase [Phycisphaerales bacterium]|nr:DNA modification methylase [Phycisphaerales bacterium]
MSNRSQARPMREQQKTPVAEGASESRSRADRPRLRLEWVESASLTPNPANWRRHPAGQLSAIKGVIADPEIGWAGALLYNERTQRLVDGHARCEISDPKALVPVLIGSWSEAAEKKILATLDPLANMAIADVDQLQALIAEIDLSDEMFADLRGQLDSILEDSQRWLAEQEQASEIIEDEVPAPPDEAITQPGDLWILRSADGREHRLLCGNSASVADVDRLLDGQPIHLLNTDPPYNVKVEPRSNNAIAAGLSSFPASDSARRAGSMTHHQGFDVARDPQKAKPTTRKLRAKDRPLANDFVSDEEFDGLLDAWFGNVARVLEPGRSFYVWGGYANLGNYPPFLKKHGLYFSQGIVWDKQHPVLTRKDYMGAFEICFYGWREGAGHEFYGPNNATDLWHVKKVNPQSMVHLTEKPVELAARAIQYSSRPGENVLDLFGGSGSTLMAAEQTGRRAFLMELDAPYADVIVHRWEKFTGRKAQRAAI